MDALQFIQSDLTQQAVTCDVRREDSGYSSDGETVVDTTEVAIFAPASSSQVVVEGSDEATSYTGLAVPQTDSNGQLTEVIEVGDVLAPQNTGKRYRVRVKEGVPNSMAPELWRLGLDRDNAST